MTLTLLAIFLLLLAAIALEHDYRRTKGSRNMLDLVFMLVLTAALMLLVAWYAPT